ncbi:MAG: serine hydroxymethyltransferase, partial [Lactobacillus johnsonii]|nr:serine hydroxymethyltransferase [Lactobacillus johnsonii]
LDSVNITTNKESIPGDKRSPFITSGLRIGTPAITSRGFKESDAKEVAKIIIEVLDTPEDAGVLAQAKERVNNLVTKYPIK